MSGSMLGWFLNLPYSAVSVSNTVAPSIASDSPVIGTQIDGDDGTWTGAPALTYQWQHYTGGAWSDIGGATSKNYTPVDADFGLALRLGVIPNGQTASTAYSNSTGLTQEAPAQSLGSELVTNGNMETGDPPSNWTATGDATLDGVADERTGGSGAQALSVARGGANAGPIANQTISVAAGSWYETTAWLKNVDATSGVRVYYTNPTFQPGFVATTSWFKFCNINYRSAATSVIACQSYTSVAATGGRFDDVSVKPVTLNTQLTAPSANMRLDVFYTLPGSPATGTQIVLLPRISDFSAGNYWKVLLEYTGSQWNITLYSAASHVLTSRISASNIGASDGVRVNMNGDSISLYTTSNGGSSWTQRGSTISNSTYQTATDVNALWTSDITPSTLAYAPAD